MKSVRSVSTVDDSRSLKRNDAPITGEQAPGTDKRMIHKPKETTGDSNINSGAEDLNRAGWFHPERLRSQGTLDDELGKAIKYFEDTVSLTDGGDPNFSGKLADLGIAYNDRYRRLGGVADLEKAIECHSRALALTPDNHPDKPRRYASLGVSCMDRYKRLGELSDLERAIECHSRALALTPDNHPDISRRYANLGVSYTDRYRRLGEVAALEKAIECNSRALALTPDGHSNMPNRHTSLGVSYGDRYRRLGKLSDLNKAIECHSHALELTPNDYPDMPYRHFNLGMSYTDQYRRLGGVADLEKAIECHSRALALTPDNHPDISRRYANLGVSYTDRYRRLGNVADLEKAIECKSRALALTPDNHPDISRRYANLGVSYTDQYKRLGELSDLEKAIECHSRALALTPDGHPDLPSRHASLGVSYRDRYQCLSEIADLEKAIECKSRALALTPNSHPEISDRHANLGVSYRDRYQCLGEVADLEKAIECDSRALALTPDNHPDISNRHTNMSVSYRDRYRRLGEVADLEKAIECDSQALELTPNGHPDLLRQHLNRALNLLHRYQHTSDPSDLECTLQSFCKATQLPTGAPRYKFQCALEWIKQASKYPALNLIEAYQTAINLLPQFIWLGATTSQRYIDLLTTENLAIKSCCAVVSLDCSRALEWLEHARCIVWSQSLALRSPIDALRASHPDLASRLQTVAHELQTFGSQTQTINPTLYDFAMPEETGRQRRRLAGEYQDLLAQARQLPGFESFLQPIKAKELMRVARSGPVVVVNCHGDQCDALVILPGHDEVKHLALPTFTEYKAQQARSQLEASLKHRRLRQRGVRIIGPLGFEDRMEDMLRTLWGDIIRPVLDDLGYTHGTPFEDLPHITWCPTGTLSFLPLHAAGDYSQPQSSIFDYAISSYTPTLSALLASTPSSQNFDCRLLAVGQATTPSCTPLPGTAKELAHIEIHAHKSVEYSQLVDHQATTTSVLDAMEHHDWVHLACHAYQNVNDPTKSGFFLHDGTLDLASINRRSFKNKGLAFLSACQTAAGDENLPDEAIHLASGMLMAGYPSVIATMWSVVDEDAPFVADKVYGQLMKDRKIGNGEAGRALHYAVAELREKVGEKDFGRWMPYIHIGS